MKTTRDKIKELIGESETFQAEDALIEIATKYLAAIKKHSKHEFEKQGRDEIFVAAFGSGYVAALMVAQDVLFAEKPSDDTLN